MIALPCKPPAITSGLVHRARARNYLRLLNRDGKPVTAGIRRWVARDPRSNPLPRRYVGDLPRFYRPEIIRWTEEETKRHNNRANVDAHQEKRVVTPLHVQEDNVGALTAAAS